MLGRCSMLDSSGNLSQKNFGIWSPLREHDSHPTDRFGCPVRHQPAQWKYCRGAGTDRLRRYGGRDGDFRSGGDLRDKQVAVLIGFHGKARTIGHSHGRLKIHFPIRAVGTYNHQTVPERQGGSSMARPGTIRGVSTADSIVRA